MELYHFLASFTYPFKGKFMELRKYHKFANLFSKLSESTFNKELSKFKKKKYNVKSIRLAVLLGIP